MKILVGILGLGLIFGINSQALAQSYDTDIKSGKKVETKEELDSYLNENSKDSYDYRVNPIPNQPLANYSGNEASRYKTGQGWSRSSYGSWWWGGRSSDMNSAGYTRPSSSK